SQAAGRLDGYDPEHHRLTVSGVRRRILGQSRLCQSDDLIPVPCNRDCLAMAYALKVGDQVAPLPRFVSPETLVSKGRNTLVVERDEELRAHVFELFATNHSPESQACSLADL